MADQRKLSVLKEKNVVISVNMSIWNIFNLARAMVLNLHFIIWIAFNLLKITEKINSLTQ